MIRFPTAAAGLILLTACGSPEQPSPVPDDSIATDTELVPDGGAAAGADDMATPVATPADAFAGEWTGPEGLVLNIATREQPGTYDVMVTLLDGTETYKGTADGQGIRFDRGGVPETIRRASGDETGLKYLAGKTDCLMIKQGEGFCRD